MFRCVMPTFLLLLFEVRQQTFECSKISSQQHTNLTEHLQSPKPKKGPVPPPPPAHIYSGHAMSSTFPHLCTFVHTGATGEIAFPPAVIPLPLLFPTILLSQDPIQMSPALVEPPSPSPPPPTLTAQLIALCPPLFSVPTQYHHHLHRVLSSLSKSTVPDIQKFMNVS